MVSVDFWVLITAVVGLLLLFWLNIHGVIWRFIRTYWYLRQIHNPPMGHWFWGHLLWLKDMDERVYMESIWYVQEEKHRFVTCWFGPLYASVDVHHPEVVEKLLKEPKSRPIYKMLMPWLGEGLLISEGKKWYRSRRLLTPAFHFEILKPYVQVYNNCLSVMLQKWSSSANQEESVKLFDTISLLSLDIVLQCAFSYKSDCQNLRLRHPYIKAVYDLIQLCSDRFMNPLYHIDWIYGLSPPGRRMKQACKTVHDFSKGVIFERKKALGLDDGQVNKKYKANEDHEELFREVSKSRKYLDFLDILLTSADDDGDSLTDTEIRSEADTFMFEGHDTTTSGISWTLYCLAQHPEHQEKVREEVRNTLMGREWLEYDDLKHLKYTQWCIKEAMRLYPPVFQFYRKSTKDIAIEGQIIPKDVQINFTPFLIHRHPDVWENPNEFDPLRFHPNNAEGRHPYAYIPFSAGYRNCIGQNFAMNEEKVVVGTIVNRFALSVDEDHKVELALRVILRTANDIKLKLKPL